MAEGRLCLLKGLSTRTGICISAPIPLLTPQVWSAEVVAQPEGAQRSAELVAALTGTDAAEQFLQLVFGGSKGGCVLAGSGQAQ